MFDIGWLDDPTVRTRLIPWLVTYAVHGTLLLGAAWALSRPIGRRWPALEERLWKTALVGGLVTASLSSAGWLPALQWAPSDVVAPSVMAVAVAAPPTVTAASPTVTVTSWLAVAVAAWAFAAAAFLLSLGFSGWRLHRRLARRETIAGGPLPAILDALRSEAGYRRRVRLTSCQEIAVPVAFGLLRPEICLPARATGGLSQAQLAAAIGHELAHLVRRDPAWRLVARLAEGVFFFQPLHRLAARRLERLSEDLCDDWAASRTGGVALARCLADVAGWSISRPHLFPLPGMAVGRSQLERRVRRLLDRDAGRRAAQFGPAPRRRFALLAAALLATTWMVPSWSAAPGPVPQDEEEAAVESAEAREDEGGEEEREAEIRVRYEKHLARLEAELHEREGAYRMREEALREHEEALRRQVEKLQLQEAEIREQAEHLERQLRGRAEELQQQEELMRDILRRQEAELRQQHERLVNRARQQEEQALERARRMEHQAQQLAQRQRQQEESARDRARMMEERARELAERAQQQERQALERALELEERARRLAEEERQREKEEKEKDKEKEDGDR